MITGFCWYMAGAATTYSIAALLRGNLDYSLAFSALALAFALIGTDMATKESA